MGLADGNEGGGEFKHVVSEDEREKAKYTDTFVGRLAKNKKFEATTMTVIVLNALAIGWDADYSARYGKPDNLYDGPIEFIICECSFAAYFTFEILIRFFGYRHKSHIFCDFWFVFDSILVTFMVVETWVLPLLSNGSPLGQLSILRLLRLLRISRMAKLMRSCPEILVIIRGITTALKAVVWTAVLLVIITYTWAILFTNEFHQGNKPDEELSGAEALFGTMMKSMLSLLVMGTILDDVTACSDAIRESNSFWMLMAFILYILLNSFTMMNMLVGILVDVVANATEEEHKRLKEDGVTETIRSIFGSMDKDANGGISRSEFIMMRKNRTLMRALRDLEINEKQFDMFVNLLFQDGFESSISFDRLLHMILRLRPGTVVSSLDFAALKNVVTSTSNHYKDKLENFEDESRDMKIDSASLDKGADPKSVTSQRINASMLAQLEQTHSKDMVRELARRHGVPDLECTGIPLAMMDEEMQRRIHNFEIHPVIGIPQDINMEFSK